MASSQPFDILAEWLHRLPGNLDRVAIEADTRLIDSGLLDSLGILELVSFLEDSFAFALPLDEFVPANFATPAAIVAMLDRLCPAAAAD